jgi:hypothetical protein
MILFFNFNLPKGTTLSKSILNVYINDFWSKIFHPLHNKNNNIHLMLMVKVQFKNSELGYRTLAQLRRVNFNNRTIFLLY